MASGLLRFATSSAVHWLLILIIIRTARGQSVNATCHKEFDFLNNDLNQNPCLVAAYILTPCSGSGLVISPPSPGVYGIPGTGVHADQCSCSSVTYMLVSACAACQGILYPTWDMWKDGCKATDVSFRKYVLYGRLRLPGPVPKDTEVPAWAYGDLVNDGFDLGAVSAGVQGVPLTTTPTSSASSSVTSRSSSVTSSSAQETSTQAALRHSSPHHMAVILGASIPTAFIALIAIGILTVYILRRRASAATSSDVLRALPVPVLQPLQRSGLPLASEKLARLFDFKRHGRVQPYAPAHTSTTSAQPKYREFKDHLGSRPGLNAEDTDVERAEGPNARRLSAAPTLDDAQAGVALVEAARSAGFRVDALLASLRRVQPDPIQERDDSHAIAVPPPTYDDAPVDEPERSRPAVAHTE